MVAHLLALAYESSRILRVDVRTGTVSTFLEGTGSIPDGIVIADRVYWTTMGQPQRSASGLPGEQGLDFSASNGGLHSVSLAGDDLRDITEPGAITTGKQLTTVGGRLYWSDREGRRVGRVRPDGTGLEYPVVNQPEPEIMAECVGVAVDPTETWVYWSQKGPSKGGRGRIFRARIDGHLPVAAGDVELLWDALPEPIDLEIADGWLYWTDRGAPPLGNTLNRAPIPAPGAAGDRPTVLAEGFQEAIGLAVDRAAGVVYVSDLSGSIRAVPLPGTDAAERIVAQTGEPVTGIALTDDEEGRR